MNKMILTKFIYIQEIWVNQNVNICSNTIDYVYEKINDYNPIRKRKKIISLMTWLQILWAIKNFKP